MKTQEMLMMQFGAWMERKGHIWLNLFLERNQSNWWPLLSVIIYNILLLSFLFWKSKSFNWTMECTVNQDFLKFCSTICGSRVRVEHSTGKVRPKPWLRGGRPPRSGGRRPFHPDDKCYECGGRGHYAYDCTRRGRSHRSSKRSRYAFNIGLCM